MAEEMVAAQEAEEMDLAALMDGRARKNRSCM